MASDASPDVPAGPKFIVPLLLQKPADLAAPHSPARRCRHRVQRISPRVEDRPRRRRFHPPLSNKRGISARPRGADCCRRLLRPVSILRRPARWRWLRFPHRRNMMTTRFSRGLPNLPRPCRPCRSLVSGRPCPTRRPPADASAVQPRAARMGRSHGGERGRRHRRIVRRRLQDLLAGSREPRRPSGFAAIG